MTISTKIQKVQPLSSSQLPIFNSIYHTLSSAATTKAPQILAIYASCSTTALSTLFLPLFLLDLLSTPLNPRHIHPLQYPPQCRTAPI